MNQKEIKLDSYGIAISNTKPFTLIAGLCSIENERDTIAAAARLKEICSELGICFIFKASYDKANRSSAASYRGPGLQAGLRILGKVKSKFGVPVLIDVHCTAEVLDVSRVADIIQVPAFLSRQTDLVLACAGTGLPVNIKKGQFLAPEDVFNIIEKIESAGNKKILLTERGASFGYHNLVVDFRSFEIMKRSGYPVIFDATHSVQLPGGLGRSTGGNREFVLPLSKAACSLGIAGVFVEVHKNPDKAPSDGANSLKISAVKDYLKNILKFDRAAKK